MSLQVPPKRRKQDKKIQRRLNIEQPKEEGIKTNYKLLLNDKLPAKYPDDVEQYWSILKQVCYTTGFLKRKHQDWFDENNEEIQSVIDQKRMPYNIWQNDPNSLLKKQIYLQAKAEVQGRTRTLKNEWWTTKAVEMENLAASNNTRAFFSATKIVYGPSSKALNPLRSKDGSQLLKDPASISSRWKEHFQELLNRESHVNDDILNQENPCRCLVSFLM